MLDRRKHQVNISSKTEPADILQVILHLLRKDRFHIDPVDLIGIADVADQLVLILEFDRSQRGDTRGIKSVAYISGV